MLRGNFNDTGGRQIHLDDMGILQDELLKAVQLQYNGQGAFVVQGCQVTGSAGNYTIAGGIVYINGKIMEFSSTSGIVSLPRYMVQAANEDQDSFTLEQGGSAYKRTLIKAELVSSPPGSGEFITITTSGGRNYNDILATQFVRLIGNQTVNGQKSFSSDVISNGVNVNTAINNINANLALKANSSISITGVDGLYGGGNFTTNRSIGLSDGGVTNGKIANGSVTENKLADNAVTTTKVANGNITTSKLADSSVTASKIADGHVTNSKIADGSVTNSKLSANSVSADKIYEGNVTASKIADGNVTNSKLGAGSVTADKIADGNVTNAKIGNGAVSVSKLGSDTLDLFRGNPASDDYSVDLSTFSTIATRTYSNKLWTLTYNTSRIRPYVKFQMQAMRDSGGTDRIRLDLQRSDNGTSGFVTIAQRTYRLDGDSWTTCIVDVVDEGCYSGNNYYRLVATNIDGTVNYMSNNFTGTIFGVDYY